MGQQNEANYFLDTLSKEKVSKHHFEFLYIIGKGGFGKVWKVKCKFNNKFYALKQMSKLRIIDSASTSNIISEKNLLSKLNNNFIVNMLCSFQDFNFLYLVMDLLTGGDLRFHIDEVVAKERTFEEDQIKFVISNLILATEYIHSKCVIHRDIKPENILFDKNGYAHITDFGIARINLDKNPVEVIGTPGYMAPEILFSEDYSYSSDYYGIGIVTYELMFCERPYKETSMKLLREEMNYIDIKLSKKDILFSDYSFEMGNFVNKLVIKKPNKRLGGKNGIEELKNHEWLKDVKWDELKEQKLKSPFADFIKNFKKDEIYDEEYIEEKNPIGLETHKRYQKILEDNSFIDTFKNYTCICFPQDKTIYPNEINNFGVCGIGKQISYGTNNKNKPGTIKANKNLPMLVFMQKKMINNLKNVIEKENNRGYNRNNNSNRGYWSNCNLNLNSININNVNETGTIDSEITNNKMVKRSYSNSNYSSNTDKIIKTNNSRNIHGVRLGNIKGISSSISSKVIKSPSYIINDNTCLKSRNSLGYVNPVLNYNYSNNNINNISLISNPNFAAKVFTPCKSTENINLLSNSNTNNLQLNTSNNMKNGRINSLKLSLLNNNQMNERTLLNIVSNYMLKKSLANNNNYNSLLYKNKNNSNNQLNDLINIPSNTNKVLNNFKNKRFLNNLINNELNDSKDNPALNKNSKYIRLLKYKRIKLPKLDKKIPVLEGVGLGIGVGNAHSKLNSMNLNEKGETSNRGNKEKKERENRRNINKLNHINSLKTLAIPNLNLNEDELHNIKIKIISKSKSNMSLINSLKNS